MSTKRVSMVSLAAATLLLSACAGGNQNGVIPSEQQDSPQIRSASQNAASNVRYKLIDLGTFGGPASTLPNGTDGIFNNEGTLTGWADTATADPFCVVDCFATHAFRWSDGMMTDLGALPGGTLSQGVWISPNGLIAGNSENGAFDAQIGGPEQRAVLFSRGVVTDMGHLPGGNSSLATGVNDRAQVIGFAFNGTPDPFSLIAPGVLPTQTRAFVWQSGAIEDIGTLGGGDAAALLINEAGEIAGQSYTNSTPNATTGVPTTDPFFWKNGTMTDIGTLGGTAGQPYSMNDRGQVVGVSNLSGDSLFHPFLWAHGVLTDLGTLGGKNGETNWINNDGDIVGKADLPGAPPQNHDAVLWRHGSKIDLGKLPGDACSNAYYVNSHGQVVGTSEDRALCLIPAGQHAFLWQNGGPMVDLNSLIPAGAGLHLTFAFSINDRGQIAGIGTPAGCSRPVLCGHAYVLVPCNASVDASRCREEHLGALEPRTLRPALPHQRFNPLNASPWFRCHRASCAGASG